MTSQDFGRPWQPYKCGRTRSFLSHTWWSPQESHQTSQVMLHWSEKCKTWKRLRLGVNAFLWRFCCQVRCHSGLDRINNIRHSNKKIKLHQLYHHQAAWLHRHLQLSSFLLPSWRLAYLGDSLSSCPEQCLFRRARTTQHTWILALNNQFNIQKIQTFGEKPRHRSEREDQTSCKKRTNS